MKHLARTLSNCTRESLSAPMASRRFSAAPAARWSAARAACSCSSRPLSSCNSWAMRLRSSASSRNCSAMRCSSVACRSSASNRPCSCNSAALLTSCTAPATAHSPACASTTARITELQSSSVAPPVPATGMSKAAPMSGSPPHLRTQARRKASNCAASTGSSPREAAGAAPPGLPGTSTLRSMTARPKRALGISATCRKSVGPPRAARKGPAICSGTEAHAKAASRPSRAASSISVGSMRMRPPRWPAGSWPPPAG
mmetsp:Transcript_41764/g.129362  ORF Transcript_41764/g.129362 Transcript_41764/m.129362 type:complete len:257 (+) Transcript_41764:110-880(+)